MRWKPSAAAPAAPPAPPASIAGGGPDMPWQDRVPIQGRVAAPTTPPSDESKPQAAKPAEGLAGGGTVLFSDLGTGYKNARSFKQDKLLGFRSLKIDVQPTGNDQRQLLTFHSLGVNPEIGITLARRNRKTVLVWGLAMAVFVLGVALTGRPVRQKVAFVLAIALASALLPLAWDSVSVAQICNGVFYATSLLAPYYLAAGLVRWILPRTAWPNPAGSSARRLPRLPVRSSWHWSRCSRPMPLPSLSPRGPKPHGGA